MIKVMSYNVCWEALDAAKTKIDMTKCIVNNKNKCMLNICNIINTRLLDNYDFICLQEINDKQMNRISKYLTLDNYKIIIKNIQKSGIMILYNKKYKLLKKYSGNLINSNIDKRPYIISIFANNIVLINLHMPHIYQNEAFNVLKNKLSHTSTLVNNKTIYIMCGDFNNNSPHLLSSFTELLPNNKLRFVKEPKKIKTCCNPNGYSYKLSYDHVYISSNMKYTQYKTINKKEMSK
jgi:exonuclease III